MGYYTRFNIEASRKIEIGWFESLSTEEEAEVVKALIKISGYECMEYTFDNFCDDEMKWYDIDRDMVMLSRQFPDLYFVVSGFGEEHDDQWIAYFHDGHEERIYARIVFDRPSDMFAGL